MADQRRITHTPRCTIRSQWWSIPVWQLLAILGIMIALSGCLLMSGERTTIDIQAGTGNLSTDFVSAEGEEARSLKVADGPGTVLITVFVAVELGDLRLELLQPDGEVIATAGGRSDTQAPKPESAQIQTDERGYIHYRVYAHGARNGSYQLLFQGL